MKEAAKGRFPTTRWTLIKRLNAGDEGESRAALDELCVSYHYPLYCYLRWRGLKHHDAQDALHDFLSKLLRLEAFKQADAEKGRLRTFLATALQRFLMNRHRDNRRHAGDISIDADVERRFQHEAFADDLTPEKVLERIWAAEILRAALRDLAEAEEKAGRGASFRVLEPFLSPDGGTSGHEQAAQALGLNAAATRQMLKRLRDKFRIHLRRRVAETLTHPSRDMIDEELTALRAAME
ncbi:MAG: sigma-70 family RNA polymerase sigma factor [Verrucomicrobiales bacterium]|nr:sigma-70 family RNA polymerase sigma factor [Verrucomicrobiales bacterium]